LAMFLGAKLKSPWRERIGVWEPLDGILLGAASSVGFTLLETLGDYVPRQLHIVIQQTGTESGLWIGQYLGLELLIPRILGEIAGHMAYSGYFGYFIGLSVLKPHRRWQILGIGYLSAATIHTFWDSVDAFTNNNVQLSIFLHSLIGIVAYLFLMAAILKARQLSPTRSQNLATGFSPRNYP